jgi:hypothetical protein
MWEWVEQVTLKGDLRSVYEILVKKITSSVYDCTVEDVEYM